MATAAERHNKPCFDRPACGGPLSDGYAGRRPSEPPGEHPQRPYGWCAPEAPPRRTGLLNAMTMIVPAGEGRSRHGATVGFALGLRVSGRGSAGRGGRVGADHVFQGGGEAQPSYERVGALAGEQPTARRVGTSLKLEGDAHRWGLIHTGQHGRRGGGPRHGVTVVFCRPRGGTAGSGADDRSAAGSWRRELIESFR